MSDTNSTDAIRRVITHGGAFRLVTAVTTSTVDDSLKTQGDVDRASSALYGQLLTAAVLVRQMMAVDMRVQMSLRDPARGSLFADSHPDGMTRGLVQLSGDRPPLLGEETLLKVTRTLANRELQQGVVDTAHDLGLGPSLSNYMRSSEQVSTVTDVATLVADDGGILRSAGYMLQLLPDADPTELAAVTAQIETLGPLDDVLRGTDELSPETLVAMVMGDLSWRDLGTDEIHFGCNCSEDRVIAALGTIGRDELHAAVRAEEMLEIDCEHCDADYSIDPRAVLAVYDA